MKIRPILLLAALGVLGFGGYRYLGSRKTAEANHEAEVYEQAFNQGKAPAIVAPSLSVGNVYDLQFRLVEQSAAPGRPKNGSENSNSPDDNIPIPHTYFHVVESGNVAGVTAGRSLHERVPYRRDGDKYVQLAVPPGVVSAEVTAINSKGQYFLTTQSPVQPGEHAKSNYSTAECFVTDGKYYDVKELYHALFGTDPDDKFRIDTSKLNDEGDLVVDSDRGSFWLKPIPHASN